VRTHLGAVLCIATIALCGPVSLRAGYPPTMTGVNMWNVVGQDGPSLSYEMTLPSDYNFRLVLDTALPVTDSTGKSVATKQPGMLLLTEAPTAAGAGAAQAINTSFTVN
jgi:hypothetical protein